VVELKDGKEVVQFLEVYAKHSSKPLLVVLDMNMPRMNGKETVIKIRSHSLLKDIPILIYSTSNNKSEAAFCQDHLVTWVTKPSSVQGVKEVAKVLAEFCKTQL
jgi:CheY-like chemotaxis protein